MRSKQLSSEPGCSAQTQPAYRVGSSCWAPSPGGCAASVGCPTGGPAPARSSTRWRRDWGKEGQGRVRVVACGQAPALVPVSIPCFLPAECGALNPGDRLLKSLAPTPRSGRYPSLGFPIRTGLFCSSWERGSGCRLLRGGVWGTASRAQGTAIWSLAAGGARVTRTGPDCGTLGRGQWPARGGSA